MAIHASPTADATGDGSAANPMQLQAALYRLAQPSEPESVLYLHDGVYSSPSGFKATGINGAPGSPKVICAAPHEHAVIEVAVDEFRAAPNEDWQLAPQVGDGVYVSINEYDTPGVGGSFIDRPAYTRLIVHQFLKDLAAANDKSGQICDNTLDGPPGRPRPAPATGTFPRRPYIYMGPGIHQLDPFANPAEKPKKAKILVRLSPTNNAVSGLDEYDEESDPRNVPLAIWVLEDPALRIYRCHSLTIRNLTVRHGNATIGITESSGLRLDHLDIYVGKAGIEVHESCESVSITNCLVDGGLPPWFFRSDKKDGVHLVTDKDDNQETAPGENTIGSLLGGTENAISHTTIHHCEFVNGHDLYTFGRCMRFSRNWIRNLNDDAVVIDTVNSEDVWIYDNVVEQCQTAISSGADAGNGTFVFRNLFDLRRPIAKTRPRLTSPPNCDPDASTRHDFEHASLMKSNYADGPLCFFHNTCVAKDNLSAAAFNLFARNTGTERMAFNNIFIAIDTVSHINKPIWLLPLATDPVETDGNCFHRADNKPGNMFRRRQGEPLLEFADLSALQHDTSGYFAATHAEAQSVQRDPLLRSFRPGTENPSWYDDLRPQPVDDAAQGVGVWQRGVELKAPLANPDARSHEHLAKPDIGCFQTDDPPLAVGVDGRRVFPKPSGPTHGDPDDPVLPI